MQKECIMAFCSNCGNKLSEGVNFCTNCGTKIKDSALPVEYSDPNSQSSVKKAVKIACNYDGTLIQVVNSITIATLYVDGILVDQYYSGLNAVLGKILILKAINYPFKSGSKTIQIFCKSGLVSVKFMLCIDGNYIGGDRI
jgi:hypothetical protein